MDIVKAPEIRRPNRTLDYGVGFYATSSYDQAVSWVKRRMAESKSDSGYINIYEYDQKEKSNLNSEEIIESNSLLNYTSDINKMTDIINTLGEAKVTPVTLFDVMENFKN